MSHFQCDRCGRGLLTDADVRYRVRIEVTAAYDPLEITQGDLERDHAAEMALLLRQLAASSEQEVNDSVHKLMFFDLCATCQRQYLGAPLGVTLQ